MTNIVLFCIFASAFVVVAIGLTTAIVWLVCAFIKSWVKD